MIIQVARTCLNEEMRSRGDTHWEALWAMVAVDLALRVMAAEALGWEVE